MNYHAAVGRCQDPLDLRADGGCGQAKRLWLRLLILASSCAMVTGAAQHQPPATPVDPLRAPWRDTRTALVIDIYEQNLVDWEKLAAEPRVAGVIHRASSGLTADRAYSARHAAATKRGFLWGSYHVGTADNADKQAEFYLQTIGDARRELLVLDLENVTNRKSMNVAQAQKFLDRVHRKTGRYPMVYVNHSTLLAIRRAALHKRVWARTRLWYARYKDAIMDFPACGWRGYTLWQFSSELRPGPARGAAFYPISGTSADIDVNVYGGTIEEMRRAWPLDGNARN
jgi:lysozyme